MNTARELGIEASASGRFAKTPFSHLLIYALERQLTGTFELTPPNGDRATVSIVKGHVAKVRTRPPVAYLGSILYERGLIDDATLNATLHEVAGTRRLHGAILLGRAAITPEQLDRALRDQLIRKLFHIFSFSPQTEFQFYEGFDALRDFGGEDGPLLDPLAAVWRGMRAFPPTEHVAASMARIAGSTCMLLPTAQLERFELELDESTIAELMRSQRLSPKDLTAVPIMKASTTQLLLHFLLVTKQVKLFDAEAAPVSRRVSKAPSLRADPTETSHSLPPVSQQPPPRQSHQRLTATAAAAIDALRPARAPGPVSFTMRAVTEQRPVTLAPPPEKDHQGSFQAAEHALAQKDFETAHVFCRRAQLAVPDDADYCALLAWIEAHLPENSDPEITRAKITMLDAAVRLNVQCERAYFYRALLHERLEHHNFAFRDFRRVVHLNPKNVEAMRQVRIYEMRVRNDAGVFKRLFKK